MPGRVATVAQRLKDASVRFLDEFLGAKIRAGTSIPSLEPTGSSKMVWMRVRPYSPPPLMPVHVLILPKIEALAPTGDCCDRPGPFCRYLPTGC